MSSCPTWCTVEGEHGVHYRLVAAVRDMTVALRQTEGRPVRVIVTVYTPGTTTPVDRPPGSLAPLAARTIGRKLIAALDAGRGEALIAAADLAESGGAP